MARTRKTNGEEPQQKKSGTKGTKKIIFWSAFGVVAGRADCFCHYTLQ